MTSNRRPSSIAFRFFLYFVLLVPAFISFPGISGAATQITLAWDANSEPDLEGYRLYARQADREYNYTSPACDGSETSCTIDNLVESVEYCFVVRAYDADGNESTDSNEVCLSPTQVDPADIDGDSDGFTANQGDCNDEDDAVYPGATEVCGDGIDQNCSGADLTCSEDEGMAKEAEDGNIIGAFEIGSDPAASGGRYVYVPGYDVKLTPDEARKLEFTFNVSPAGNYRIRAWVYAPDGAHDSFLVKVNGNPSGGYEWHVLQNTFILKIT
jgi:hypothetical protein